MPDAAGEDLDLAFLTGERERHGENGLERIALAAAVRRDVGLSARRPGAEVEDGRDGLGWNAGPIVAHADLAPRYRDADRRRDGCLLAGIERIVDQFFDDHHRPRVGLCAGLCDQLLARAELEQARGRERRALQGRAHRRHAAHSNCGSLWLQSSLSTGRGSSRSGSASERRRGEPQERHVYCVTRKAGIFGTLPLLIELSAPPRPGRRLLLGGPVMPQPHRRRAGALATTPHACTSDRNGSCFRCGTIAG
jgi:hypothetical protein